MDISIKEVLHKINISEAVRSAVPLGMGAGLPMLEIAGERLLVSVFYFRSNPKPDDKTELFAPKYIISVSYPECKLAAFRTLPYEEKYAGTNFNAPVGTFRHDAIKNLNHKQYVDKKNELYALLDKQTAYLAGDDDAFSAADRDSLRGLYATLAEPSLLPFYRDMSETFFNQYFTKG